MGANQLCRIVDGISSEIGQDGHRDMGDVSTYGKSIRNLLGSMKPPSSNLCADTRRYKFIPKLLLRCGLFVWTRFRLILRNVLALSGL